MNLLAKTIHGSRLYGLHSESSDYDFKGIHLPTQEECLLMNACKNTSTKEENVEYECFALQQFLKMGINGEDCVIAMLHCSDKDILHSSPIFESLRQNKKNFYTKRMAGSLGYAKNMALKYGFRADRLNALKHIAGLVDAGLHDNRKKFWQIWDALPEDNEFFYKGADSRNNNKDNRFFEVAGKKLQATIDLEYAREILGSSIQRYGDRVISAAAMNGTDWKAVSHSFRVGYQLLHIYRDGGFVYPLPETDFIKDVKYGKMHFVNDKIDIKLNDLVLEVENSATLSNYPQSVDWEWVRFTILWAYDFQS